MEKLVQIKTIKETTRLSKYVIDLLIEERKFPQPIVLTDRISVWKESEIQRFISDPAGYADYLAEQEELSEKTA